MKDETDLHQDKVVIGSSTQDELFSAVH